MNISTKITFKVDTAKIAQIALQTYHETGLPIMTCIEGTLAEAVVATDSEIFAKAVFENEDTIKKAILADAVILQMTGTVGD